MDEDMPVDPHEPRYCICNQVSFGEMVQCENPEVRLVPSSSLCVGVYVRMGSHQLRRQCEREWFHFQCVGLTEAPTDDWYCPDCRVQMRRGRRMGRRSDE
jgi:hypothetical protein